MTLYQNSPKNAYKEKAERYRLTALSLNPDRRQYYLDQAVHYENLAAQCESGSAVAGSLVDSGIESPAMITRPERGPIRIDSVIDQVITAVATSDQGPGRSESGGDSPSPSDQAALVNLDAYAKIHSILALRVLAEGKADLHHAFTIWAIWRGLDRENKTWLTRSEFNDIAQSTGRSGRTIAKWIKAGEGIFWSEQQVKGESQLWLIGIDRVGRYFNLNRAQLGRVLAVPIRDLLSPKLQQLRANLYATWVNRGSRWASRETIEKLTGISPRSQRNYEKLIGAQKSSVYALWRWQDSTGRAYQAKQLPNRYQAKHTAFYGHHTGKRHGLDTTDTNGAVNGGGNVANSGQMKRDITGRILFDNVNSAAKKAYRLKQAGVTMGNLFAVVEPKDRRGSAVLVRPLPIIQAGPVYA